MSNKEGPVVKYFSILDGGCVVLIDESGCGLSGEQVIRKSGYPEGGEGAVKRFDEEDGRGQEQRIMVESC